ncbi:MAG: hypothetical protein LBT40_01610 [Deltaproteobacteria bacterium]|jgi:hypothetical protein|nr:hypothetical protein [Deltaproteobacteria bacterium]
MDAYDGVMLFLLGIFILGCAFRIVGDKIIIPRLEKKDAEEARAASRTLLSPDGQPLQRGGKTGRSA